LSSWKDKFEALIEASKSELADIKTTYDQKLALQASVEYWKSKKQTHHKLAIRFAWATGISAVITIILFIGLATSLLGQDLSTSPIWRIGILLAVSTFGIWITRLL